MLKYELFARPIEPSHVFTQAIPVQLLILCLK